MFLSPQREETVCVVRVKVLDHLVTERGTLCSLMLDPSIREASGQSCFLVHSPVANVYNIKQRSGYTDKTHMVLDFKEIC